MSSNADRFKNSLVLFVAPHDNIVNTGFAAIAVVLSIAFGISALRRVKKRGQDGQLLAAKSFSKSVRRARASCFNI